jgi:hypothetical protein
VITSVNQVTFTHGVNNSFTITTGSGAFPAVTVSEIGTVPAGLSFKNNGNGTATLSGDPTATTTHTVTLVIVVSATGESPAYQDLVLTV